MTENKFEQFVEASEDRENEVIESPVKFNEAESAESSINYFCGFVDDPKRLRMRLKVKMESGQVLPADLFNAEASLLQSSLKSGDKIPYEKFINERVLRFVERRRKNNEHSAANEAEAKDKRETSLRSSRSGGLREDIRE